MFETLGVRGWCKKCLYGKIKWKSVYCQNKESSFYNQKVNSILCVSCFVSKEADSKLETDSEVEVDIEQTDKLKEVIKSIASAISFSPYDWASHHRLAWIYGVIIGWDNDSIKELKEKYDWTDETVERLKTYHKTISKLLD